MHQSYKNSVCGLFLYSLETENCLYIFLKFYFILDRVGHDWSDLAAAAAELINNVKIVSGIQQSDSVILIHGSILSQIFFPFRLLQNIEQSSQCYTVGPCWLSVLNIAVSTLAFLLFFFFFQTDRASRKPCPAWVQLIHKEYIKHFGYVESLCSCYLWSLDFLVFILNMLCSLWDFSSLTRDWTTRGPWQWECGVLTTELPGNSLHF